MAHIAVNEQRPDIELLHFRPETADSLNLLRGHSPVRGMLAFDGYTQVTPK